MGESRVDDVGECRRRVQEKGDQVHWKRGDDGVEQENAVETESMGS